MTEIVNPLLQWLNANPNWAGFATFIISACESIAIIGTIIPGTVMMTAIGALAGADVIPLWPTIIWAILGAIVGDGISYLLGYYFDGRLRYIWPFSRNPDWLDKGEVFFRKHGGKSVFIGRFVGPVRAIVPLIAGMLGMKPFRFYVANILSAIGWAPIYMFPGILLGAVSLELPPDIAAHVILMLLLVTLFIVLCGFTVYKIFILISHKVNEFLNWVWKQLKKSHYCQFITSALKHHNPQKTHGQLVFAFYFIVVSAVFLYLMCDIALHGTQSIFINNALFHFFRSLRSPLTDNIMLGITLLGEKTVVVPLVVILFAWLVITKRLHAAWHVLALGILAVLSVETFKYLVHSPRPWGLLQSPENFSFPSGHTTLSVTFYVGLALLLSASYKLKHHWLIYSSLILALIVSISRLYLGAHWFTDVLGGWLLSVALILLIAISYNRKKSSDINPVKLTLVMLIAFICLYGATFYHSFDKFKHRYTFMDYPVYTIPVNAWWSQTDTHVSTYRVGRFGLADQILNLQWVGSLDKIKTTLLQNNWEIPPERDWISVLQRITDIQSTENLPIVSPLHLDKKPVLVLIKRTDDKKRILVLRLWDSNVMIASPTEHLWVGTVNIIPRTYSWLFRKKATDVKIDSALLFEKTLPPQYEVKEITLPPAFNKRKRNPAPVILLVKPKAP